CKRPPIATLSCYCLVGHRTHIASLGLTTNSGASGPASNGCASTRSMLARNGLLILLPLLMRHLLRPHPSCL
ncbi:hypothetical protein GW17_00054311, partial [Ensete ventricosum]